MVVTPSSRSLGPHPFAGHDGLAAVVDALGVGAVRLVGGCVRDRLLDLAVADIDLATRHRPEAVMRLLSDVGIRTVATGIAHGTVTAILPGGPVEVTTLRRDVATDGRHAVIEYADNWRDDAARRDFTMNALYADPVEGTVHDWFGGIDDLTDRRVRFIGDPRQRIAEDHLRILRFFRFHARFGDAIDTAGLDACTERANDLMALSRERIAAELLKLIIAPAAPVVVALMIARGILAAVLPEIDRDGVERLERLAACEAAFGVAPDPIRRLAALLPSDVAEGVGARLRLSNAQRRRLMAASAGIGGEGPYALAYRRGLDEATDRLLLAGADPSAIANWLPPRLPIGGGHLVGLGLRQGPQVAAALREVERRWIMERFPERDRTEAIAVAVVAELIAGR